MGNKILMLRSFQPFAHYRNPFTMDHPLTFPLPPRSTVIGMLQNLIQDPYGNKYGELWNSLQVYIVGRNISKFKHAVNLYKSDKYTFELVISKLPYFAKKNASIYNETRGFDVIEELFGVFLVLFLKGEESLLKEIKENTGKRIVSLGRGDDVVFFQKPIELEETNFEKSKSKFAITDNYGFYIIISDDEIKRFSNVLPAVGAALSSKFKIKGRIVRSRTEILCNRDLVEREVVFFKDNQKKKVYYVPPFSEIRNHDNIKVVNVFDFEDKNTTIHLVDEGWLDGQP
ncbi:MAG: CRISPR-associated protein Cas5 [Candidatus Anstonellales archaeon]